MKNQVRTLAWIYIVWCGFLLVGAFGFCAALIFTPNRPTPYAMGYVAMPILCIGVLSLLGFIGGIGLLRLRPWARILILIPSALMLPLVPIGTALGLFAFWTLLNPQVNVDFGVGNHSGVAALFPISSPALNMIGLGVCVGAAMLLALKFGFYIHHDQEPMPIAGPMPAIVAGVILFAGCIVGTLQAVSKAHRRRLAAAFAVPASSTSPYAAHGTSTEYAKSVGGIVEEMDRKFAEHSPYWEVTGRIATCDHLHPIEQDMVRHGIAVRLNQTRATSSVIAHCRVASNEFRRSYLVQPSVEYVEFYAGDPDSAERPTAYIICREHNAIVHTLHPDEARDAPSYP